MAVSDNTSLFRAHAKMIRTRKSTEAAVVKRPETSPNYGAYANKCREIAETITALRNQVFEKRPAYVLTMGSADSFASMRMTMTMSDAERNAFDAETDIAMKECSKGIIKLQKAIKSDPNIRAVDESKHLNHACDLLDMYLNSIRQIIAQMRTVRLYKTKSRQVVSRLSNLVKLHESSITSETKSEIPKAKEESDGWEHVNSQDESRSRKSWNPVQIKREAEEPLLSHEPHLHQVKPDQCFFQQELTRSAFAEPETDFTEVEELKFAMENQQLRRRLQHTNTEVEAIEKQVEELHRMQKFFSEKVMDQEVDIIKVHTAAEETVENIKDGNDLIRSAIKNGASRRVIFLFCLIVLTFTLLFLDWYNP